MLSAAPENITRGHQYSILGDDGSFDDNEEFMTSFYKSTFSFVLKKTLTCMKCNDSTID